MPARGAPLASGTAVPRGAVRPKAVATAGVKVTSAVKDNPSQVTPEGATAERRAWRGKPEQAGLGGANKKAPVMMVKTGGETQAAGSRWQSASLAGSKTAGGARAGGGAGLLMKLDGEGTNRAIEETWRAKGGRKNKGDVTGMCARIDALLDNPLMVGDEEEASLRIQKLVRGWLVRSRRARGELYPLEAQALADGQYLLGKYGARVFGLSPRSRRRMVPKP